ncbi:MAG TPA: DUF3560 domain-containing protein [Planctomycetota bacterium]|nr:DUF3560 domain-containing protein [Planctomycetota bacterium]
MTLTATYSPDDNKLRLYASARLDAEIYARVRAAGFAWAPKQGLFVAPMWTPEREDLLLDLCGEIGDEDTSLIDRAEDRADRFEDYSDKRADDADRAHKAVAAIADNIPLGQPILVGHHSERRARRDAEKIENGMRKAVKLWDTSNYWKDRAAGAIAHAKYKERPDVRARRIKGLIADIRRCKAAYTPCDPREIMQHEWNAPADAAPIPHVLCGQGRARHYVPVSHLAAIERRYARWIQHYEMRLEYEKAMLNEQGAGELIAPKPRPKQLPLVNYRAESVTAKRFGRLETLPVVEITSAQFQSIYADYRGTCEVENSHRVRIARVERTADGVKRFPSHGAPCVAVFLTDSKEHTKPAPQATPEPTLPAPRPMSTWKPPEPTKFDAMRESLRAGVQVVSAPQLFPTPPALAREMADRAGILAGKRVLEPSAGTGNILRAILDSATGADCVRVVAVEVNAALARGLEEQRRRTLHANETNFEIRCADFLECNGDLGAFDRILMNPPFENASDIKHILHARHMLKPGGRIVAICANGPRQREQLKPLASEWRDLPADTFKASGTSVNAALVVIDAEAEPVTVHDYENGLLF